MSGDTGRPADAPTGDAREGTTLVLGAANHDDACRRLARERGDPAYRVRATVDAAAGRCCTDARELYDTGVYDDLALSEAGVVVSETVAGLDAAASGLVVCVDGLPRPVDEAGRRPLLRFLHAVTHRVADAGGRCHVHLAVDPGDDLAAVVAPLFETVVDARG